MAGTPWKPRGSSGNGSEVCGVSAGMEKKSCGNPAIMKMHFTVMPLLLYLQSTAASPESVDGILLLHELKH